jgi:hypothetical protein
MAKKQDTIKRRLAKIASVLKRSGGPNNPDLRSLLAQIIADLGEKRDGISVDPDVDGPWIEACKQFGCDPENASQGALVGRLLAQATHGRPHRPGRSEGTWSRERLRELDRDFTSQINEGCSIREAAHNIVEQKKYISSKGKPLSGDTLRKVWSSHKGSEVVEILEFLISMARRAKSAKSNERKPVGALY